MRSKNKRNNAFSKKQNQLKTTKKTSKQKCDKFSYVVVGLGTFMTRRFILVVIILHE